MFSREFGAQSPVKLNKLAVSSANVNLVLAAATYSKNKFLVTSLEICQKASK